ncbi:anaerobic ribonucleoside-triphosphate reductase activating protein [Bacilli bacterium PM5-3]|nr:anaerobic ribonucleoside-triphosphate reductase activating protein [Bacilli bacterium PM5-3]
MDVNIAGILEDSIVDGPGLRTVVFFQGCKHNCLNCHNEDTHSTEINQLMSINEIVEQVKSAPLAKKVTFSGGEPFLQYEELLELCKQLHDYHIWIYTGYTKQELIDLGYDEVFNYIEALVDGPFIEKEKTLDQQFIGSKNQKIYYFNE